MIVVVKILLVDKTRKCPNVVFQHTSDNVEEAKSFAKEKYPNCNFARVWLGEPNAHRVSKLDMTHSPMVTTLLEKGGEKKLRTQGITNA